MNTLSPVIPHDAFDRKTPWLLAAPFRRSFTEHAASTAQFMGIMAVITRRFGSSTTSRNVIANYFGKCWGALMSLAFTPVYARLLGIEAYGLVGLSVTINTLLNVFDMGLSSTMNREMARLSGDTGNGVAAAQAQEARDLIRTLECIYWPPVLIIALGIAMLAPVIAHHWVHANRLAPATVQQAILLMGLYLALRWPYSLYEGALLGSQRQVLLNGITIVAVTLQNAGVVVALMISPSILTYFRWQMAVGACLTLAVCLSLWRSLPPGERLARPSRRALAPVRRYATEMAGISIVVLILTQMDKLVISHRFSLRAFGYYMLATSAASALYYGISPLYNAFFPRFVQLMAAGNESGLATLYHRGSQAASVAIFPAALLLAFYSRDLMWLWTQDRETAARTGLIVSILVLAYAANAIMHLPYGLQLASGWTRLSLGFNLLWVIGLLPILNIMTGRYGVPGAAVVWLALNCSYLIIVVPLMHRRLLRREMWRWYTVDIVSPLLGSLCVLVIAHAAVPTPTGRLALFAYLCGLWLAAACAAAALAPHIRSLVARLVLRRVSI